MTTWVHTSVQSDISNPSWRYGDYYSMSMQTKTDWEDLNTLNWEDWSKIQ